MIGSISSASLLFLSCSTLFDLTGPDHLKDALSNFLHYLTPLSYNRGQVKLAKSLIDSLDRVEVKAKNL